MFTEHMTELGVAYAEFRQMQTVKFLEINRLPQKLEIWITSKLTKQFMSNFVGTLLAGWF